MKLDKVKFEKVLAERQVNLKDLCVNAGIGISTLQKVRKGNTPRPATIGRIAKALNVPVQEIIQEGD